MGSGRLAAGYICSSILRRGITPEINAVSTIILVFSLVAIVFWYRLRTRGEGGGDAGTEIAEAVEGKAA